MVATRHRSSDGLAITGVGAVSPVGCTAAETCASVRAGLARFQENSFYTPLTGNAEWDLPEPVVASVVPEIARSRSGADRLLELGAQALRDLFREVGLRRDELAGTPLFLALPELDSTTRGWGLGPSLATALWQRTGLPPLAVGAIRCEGSAGSLAILGDALEGLRAATAERAIVLGMDTFIDARRLRILDEDYRVKSARAATGAIPGEGAVALLLERPEVAARRGAAVHGIISAVATGSEPQTRASNKESSGRGLTDALRGVLVPGAADPCWVLCDLNGDDYRAIEWGIVLGRLGKELGTVRRLSHPADCLGDVGAAMGGILLAQATAGFARGYAPAAQALLWAAAAETPARAAARISPPPR
jgi:3-oxoacyl-[acyl-carrier-protein] synthase-1